MSKTHLFVGTHGGLSHAAAALNLKAVVIFGGFIDPKILGYKMHKNMFQELKARWEIQKNLIQKKTTRTYQNKDIELTIQISVDSFPEVHNKVRKIKNLFNLVIKHGSDIGTLASEIKEDSIFNNENAVKVQTER